MNQKSMENMPITSRNTFNLALFAPGLNGSRDDEFGNPTFAFGGMQRKGFLVDGIDNTQRGGPGRLGIFSPETIQEVKVISNSMAAEYGRTVGGMISMITRGGTNDPHGEVLVLERRPVLHRPTIAGPGPSPFSSGPHSTATSAAQSRKTSCSTSSAANMSRKTARVPSPSHPRTRRRLAFPLPIWGLRRSSSGSRPIWARWITSSTPTTTSISATATS